MSSPDYTLHLLKSPGDQRVGAYIHQNGEVVVFNAPDISQAYIPGAKLFNDAQQAFTANPDRVKEICDELVLLAEKPLEHLQVNACVFAHDEYRGVHREVVERWTFEDGMDQRRIPATNVPGAVLDMQEALLLNASSVDAMGENQLTPRAFGNGFIAGLVSNQQTLACIFIDRASIPVNSTEALARLGRSETYTVIDADTVLVDLDSARLTLDKLTAGELRVAACAMEADVQLRAHKSAPMQLTHRSMPEIATLFQQSAAQLIKQNVRPHDPRSPAEVSQQRKPKAVVRQDIDWRQGIDDIERVSKAVGYCVAVAAIPGAPAAAIVAMSGYQMFKEIKAYRASLIDSSSEEDRQVPARHTPKG